MQSNQVCADSSVYLHRPVYYELGGQRFRGQLRDLSSTGAFILTSVRHAEHERIRLCWSGAPLGSWGTIERVEAQSAYEGTRWPGFSVRFESLDPEARSFVQQLLAEAQA